MRANDRENNLYDEGKRCLIQKEELFMFELLEKSNVNQQTLLDLGCGSGEITLELCNKGFDCVGVDFSSSAIALASQKGLKCEEVDLDSGMPFASSSFGIVWAGDVLEHVFDPINVIKDVGRVLVKQGLIFATIPNDLNLSARVKTLFGISYQESVYRRFRQYKHHTFFSERLVRYMFSENELKIEKIYYLVKLPFTKITFFTSFPLRLFAVLMIIKARKV